MQVKSVDEYISQAPGNRKEALIKIRSLCNEILIGYEEDLSYNMPSYKKNGLTEIAFASQKNYISFYVAIHGVMRDNKALLVGFNHGKGCIRFSNPAKIDYNIIRKLITDSFNSNEKPC